MFGATFTYAIRLNVCNYVASNWARKKHDCIYTKSAQTFFFFFAKKILHLVVVRKCSLIRPPALLLHHGVKRGLDAGHAALVYSAHVLKHQVQETYNTVRIDVLKSSNAKYIAEKNEQTKIVTK